jgi:NAD(P)-dependent dehydrogenase (short-subunit alcohol dehydrogenase family)
LKARVVLITGASSGIGQACAGLLPIYGYRVYQGSRSSAQLPLDVTSDGSVRDAIASIVAKEGRIDAVINNAGIALGGAVEDTNPDEALELFETNFFGVLRVIRAVLPHMRKQGSGRILNIGSIGGLLAIPYQGLYSASKFALEGLTESLRLELKPFGIHAVLIEPGDHRTGLTRNRRTTAASTSASPYHRRFTTAIARMSQDEQSGPDPERVARLVLKVLEARKPRLRCTTGPFLQRGAVLLKRLAPYSVIEKVMNVYYSR